MKNRICLLAAIVITWNAHFEGHTRSMKKEFDSRKEAQRFWNRAPTCEIPYLDEELIIRRRQHCNIVDLGKDVSDFTLVENGIVLYGESK